MNDNVMTAEQEEIQRLREKLKTGEYLEMIYVTDSLDFSMRAGNYETTEACMDILAKLALKDHGMFRPNYIFEKYLEHRTNFLPAFNVWFMGLKNPETMENAAILLGRYFEKIDFITRIVIFDEMSSLEKLKEMKLLIEIAYKNISKKNNGHKYSEIIRLVSRIEKEINGNTLTKPNGLKKPVIVPKNMVYRTALKRGCV